MGTFIKLLVGLLLLQTAFSQMFAAVKPPVLVLKILDADSKTPVTPLSQKIVELSTNVQKNESFIYRIEIEAEDYNSYVSTVDIPWNLRGKKVNVTNLMVSKFSSKNEGKPEAAPVVKSNASATVAISGVVRDKAGYPLPNVRVSCVNAENVVVSEQSTGTDGKYSFIGLPAGRYSVRASSARDVVGKEIRITAPQEMSQLNVNAASNSGDVPQTTATSPIVLTSENVKVVSAFNGTLVLAFQKTDQIEGINLSVNVDGKRFFITPSNELVETPTNNAFLAPEIILNNRNIRKADGSSLFQDGIPFNLTVTPFASQNRYLTNQFFLKGIVTKDTVPPPLPVLEDLSISDGRVTLAWRPSSAETEPLAYRVYYRKDSDFALWQEISPHNRELRLERSYPLLPTMKEMSNLYVTVTAVDLSGNESDFQSTEAIIEPGNSPELVADLVLENGTLPPVQFVTKAPQQKKSKPKPKVFDANAFVANGYVVPQGVKLQLKNRTFRMPVGSRVVVSPKASLLLENVRFIAKSNETWMGIVVREGALLSAKNLVVAKAETGITAGKKSLLQLGATRIQGCAVGVVANQATIVWDSGLVDRNSKAGDFSYSTVKLKDVQVVSNGKNMNFAYCSLEAEGLSNLRNRSSFYLLQGQLVLSRSSFIANGGEGLLLDGTKASIQNSRFLHNLRNGILCESDANPRIGGSDFIGNGYYAVKKGGVLVDCHVARNNKSDRVDTTPDNGSEDGQFFTFSNQSIQQIFAADSLRGLKSIPHFSQEVAR